MSTLRIGLLGPFLVLGGGRELYVPQGRQRTLLATLALRTGRVVPVEEIIDTLWDENPPGAARTTVRGHVKRLRRVLGDAIGTDGPTLVASGDGGYRLDAERTTVDTTEFRRLVERATAAPSVTAETVLLDRALALWRGAPLAGVATDSLQQHTVPVLEEERLTTLHRRIEIGLRRGEGERHVGALREVLARDGLQERFWRQLLYALHLSGRQAEALREYERCRRLLTERLGVSPGPALREAHRTLLVAGAERHAAGTGPDTSASTVGARTRQGTVAGMVSRAGAPGTAPATAARTPGAAPAAAPGSGSGARGTARAHGTARTRPEPGLERATERRAAGTGTGTGTGAGAGTRSGSGTGTRPGAGVTLATGGTPAARATARTGTTGGIPAARAALRTGTTGAVPGGPTTSARRDGTTAPAMGTVRGGTAARAGSTAGSPARPAAATVTAARRPSTIRAARSLAPAATTRTGTGTGTGTGAGTKVSTEARTGTGASTEASTGAAGRTAAATGVWPRATHRSAPVHVTRRIPLRDPRPGDAEDGVPPRPVPGPGARTAPVGERVAAPATGPARAPVPSPPPGGHTATPAHRPYRAPARTLPVPPPWSGRDGPRHTDREVLDALFAAARSTGRSTVVLQGPAGAGKSALAVRWAHDARTLFPDGCLYADLQDDGNGAPVTTDSVLETLLGALGFPALGLPRAREARSALLRAALSGRRVLLVLDGAESAEQVEPLLPGDGVAVLVTSRYALPRLIAERGAYRHRLPRA
ncbi:BTAD domain-containing putative transcriptional regulator [Streptomyces sp. NPDC057638]|uniref:AfsR/SARP family transcriptional regulator n=1 Tax=Streptomyces sp. NPDC057638 TaxID=3346190 RepID=UPI0036881E1C